MKYLDTLIAPAVPNILSTPVTVQPHFCTLGSEVIVKSTENVVMGATVVSTDLGRKLHLLTSLSYYRGELLYSGNTYIQHYVMKHVQMVQLFDYTLVRNDKMTMRYNPCE
jgi:hypothetical protein